MNKLGLECLLRSHDEDSFRGASRETAKEVIHLVALRKHACLHEGVCTEADLVLWNGEHEKRAVTSIEAEDTSLTECLLHSANHSLLVDLRVQLHHCFGVLSWIGTCDFDSTSNTACNMWLNLMDTIFKKLRMKRNRYTYR